jgi:hypothetical protein
LELSKSGQSLTIAVLAAYILVWAVQLIAAGVPTDSTTFWVVGYFTALVFYASVLVTRFALSRVPPAGSALYSLPLVATAAAAILDTAVLLRILT